MKKLINKIRTKGKKTPPPTRISSETLEEHREHVLAGGRKFKYPIQYARHKLVFNAIIIAVAAFVVAILLGWWQLYPQQNTSEFMYRVTKVIPVPVAYVDGQPVLYSDYLMKYLSSVRYLERKEQLNPKTDSGKRQIEYIKQKSMQYVVENAYAEKLASQLKVSVSENELSDYLLELRKTSAGEISEQTNDAVIMDYYGWSPSEYRYIIEKELLRQKVSYAMDKKAQEAINKVKTNLDAKPVTNFKSLSAKLSKLSDEKLTYGTSGWVPKSNQDGGIASEVSKLKKQEVSGVIKSSLGDGYYVVRMLGVRDDQVSYEYIKSPLREFQKSLDKIIQDGKVSELIDMPDSNS
jgi:hypothetical protein